MNKNHVITIPLDRGRAELDTASGLLRFVNSQGVCYYQFKLSAHIEYFEKPSQDAPLRLTHSDAGHYVFAGQDSFADKEVHLQVAGGVIDYWLVGRSSQKDVAINCVHYGQDAPGHENASQHRLEEFFILCPDRYGSGIPKKDKICFKLGVPSFRFDKDNNFPHEGGRTIIAPYVAALRSGDDWLGVGTLEIPTSEYGLNMTFKDGRAVIDFFYGGNLQIQESFTFPRITFFTRGDKLAACRAYVDRLYDQGLAQPNTQWQQAWAGPIYCFFSDQMYEYQTDRATDDFGGEMTMTENYCNDAFLQECLDFLEARAIPYRVIIIDYGWFVMNGQWRPNQKRFADFRATIKKLQAAGKKVLVWYSPYFVAQASSNYQGNPDIAVRKRDGSPFFVVRLGSEVNYQCDFTHPAMREMVARDFEYMLGSEGLDADGIKIDCTHQPPTINNLFHDPSWGTGEMFHYQAAKFMYDLAKRIKPDCCVNNTAGNPFFNRTFDLHRIHDAMEYNLDAYEERAWAAWFCRAGVSDLDDWPSYDLFTVRANLRKIAYGSPSLYAARKRGGQRKPKVPWGYAVSVSDEELQLLSSIYELCMKAPVSLDQQIHIDPFRKIFNRKHTTGKLAGFYAATTLSGNQAAAVFGEDAAWVVSIADIAISVPLPPGARDVSVQMLTRDGKTQPVEQCESIEGEAVFNAQRCCGPVRFYRIGYSL